MKNYIGAKIIKAEPMSNHDYRRSKGMTPEATEEDMPGYRVCYPDGYVSWSPKEVFEIAYREITEGEMELLK